MVMVRQYKMRRIYNTLAFAFTWLANRASAGDGQSRLPRPFSDADHPLVVASGSKEAEDVPLVPGVQLNRDKELCKLCDDPAKWTIEGLTSSYFRAHCSVKTADRNNHISLLKWLRTEGL